MQMLLANGLNLQWPTTMNGWAIAALTAYLVLSTFAPTATQQLRNWLLGTAMAQTFNGSPPTQALNESLIVKRRCADLRKAFPDAEPQLLMSWVEKGLDIEQAGQEFQERLLAEVKDLRKKVQSQEST